MTPTIQAVGPRKRLSKTTALARLALGVLGATANQRSRSHPRCPHPSCPPRAGV